jgi:hypothetical protein
MRRRVKQSVVLVVGVGVLAAVIAQAVVAQTGDTDDNVSPANTLIKGSLKPGTETTLTGTVDGATVTEHCKVSTTSGKTPATGLGPAPISPATYSGCTDNLNGTDTIKTTGVWRLTGIDAPNDEANEVVGSASGDRIRIIIPVKGATVVSSAEPGCTLTAAPTKAAAVSGAYNDINTLTIKNNPLPFSTSAGCPGGAVTGTGHFSATYVLTPGIHDVS